MTHRLATLLLVLAAALTAPACTADSDGSGSGGRDTSAADVPGPGGTFKIPSRVASIPPIEVEVLARGEGLQARVGDTAAVHYTGTLTDGSQFDTSRGDVPFEFPLGQGAVIRGWDMVVAKMRVGDHWRVQIPPQLAYGEVGSPPVIPPNATLIFDMELMRVR
jgi:hypothetical protein